VILPGKNDHLKVNTLNQLRMSGILLTLKQKCTILQFDLRYQNLVSENHYPKLVKPVILNPSIPMKPPLLSVRATVLSCCTLWFTFSALAQTIGTFNSVAPTAQQQTLVLPSTHTFQRLIKTGDALSLGGTLGDNLDFTGYVPTAGSSTSGRLSISTESTPAQVAILDVTFNIGTATWNVGTGGKVTFNPTDIGTVARFCSGTVTPNNTIMVSEEDVTAGDVNTDGYTDRGWIIEINPATRTVINQAGGGANADKLWALGRANRENALVRSDNAVLYTGTDDATFGYLYKFVPTVPGVFSSGTLYVLQTNASLGTGTWKAVPNTTTADRNNTRTLAQGLPATGGKSAYNFNGIEDVEFAPDGKVYFTAKAQGKIYRFTDNGTFNTTTDIAGLEVFAGNSSYPTITNYDVDGVGPFGAEPWGIGNDNLAFDGEGNLWVLQDGGRGHIWVIRPTHTQAVPQVRLFATTPAGSEPTGITFTPNNRYMFISFQHPGGNTTAQTDAAGTPVIFNTHTTVVIARTEFLGPGNTLPVTFTSFKAKQAETGVAVGWSVADVYNHGYFVVERSADGIAYEEIYRENQLLNNGASQSFNYFDKDAPSGVTIYYRIKQCDLDGKCRYSEIRRISVSRKNEAMLIYPVPALDKITVTYNSNKATDVTISIIDGMGRIVLKQKRPVTPGSVNIPVGIQKLMKGNFTLVLDNGTDRYRQKFSKL
jgi:hypothetical protein